MIELWRDDGSGTCVVRLSGPVETSQLLQVFDSVVVEKGWQPGNDLAITQRRSEYFGLEHCGEVIGGVQLELPGIDGLFAFHSVWPEVVVKSPQRSAHVVLLAVIRPYRVRCDFWPLVLEMWRFCLATGIDELFIECCPRVLELYRRFGWPLSVIGELRRHWGGDTYLCSMSVSDAANCILGSRSGFFDHDRLLKQMFRLENPGSLVDPVISAAAACS